MLLLFACLMFANFLIFIPIAMWFKPLPQRAFEPDETQDQSWKKGDKEYTQDITNDNGIADTTAVQHDVEMTDVTRQRAGSSTSSDESLTRT